eukprot:scaffold209589_cov35-Tisochrysis_lutea.AAC.6
MASERLPLATPAHQHRTGPGAHSAAHCRRYRARCNAGKCTQPETHCAHSSSSSPVLPLYLARSSFSTLGGTISYESSSIVYEARPLVSERSEETYWNMLASGTLARTTFMLPRSESSATMPRRELMSPITSPIDSSGLGARLTQALAGACAPRNLEGHDGGVDIVVAAVNERGLASDHGEAGEDAIGHDRLEALGDAWDVLLGHGATLDLLLEDEARGALLAL